MTLRRKFPFRERKKKKKIQFLPEKTGEEIGRKRKQKQKLS